MSSLLCTFQIICYRNPESAFIAGYNRRSEFYLAYSVTLLNSPRAQMVGKFIRRNNVQIAYRA